MLGMCGSSIKGVVSDQSGSTPGSTGAVCPYSFLPFATFTIIVFSLVDKTQSLVQVTYIHASHVHNSLPGVIAPI